jgi:hypothetical protein
MRIWLAAAAALLLFGAAPAFAERDPISGAPLPPHEHPPPSPLTDHFYIRATFFSPHLNTDLRIDPTNAAPGVTGTPVNAERDLGLPARLNQGTVEFMFRLRERSRVRVSYYEADRSGSKVLANDIQFGNQLFAAGQLVETSLDWQMFDITYTYSLYRRDNLEVGTGLGVYLLEVKARGEVPATFQEQDVSAAGPFPALPLDLAWRISSRFAFTARTAYLKAALNGFHGWFLDSHLDVQYRWIPNFALGLGYSSMRTSLTRAGGSSLPGTFAMNIGGPEVFVRFSF